MKKMILYVAVCVIAAGALGYYFLGNNKKNGEAAPTGQVQRVVKVERGDLNLSVSANGVVQPINKVEIRSKAGGQILQLNFEEGSYVRKGDLLVALDTTQTKNDYDQAKADLATALQALTQAENNAHRSKELYDKRLISDQELDQSKLDLVRAQSQLVRTRAALSTAEDRLRDTRVLAPITGVILSRNVDLGQIISSAVSNVGGGTVLATVAGMEEVYVITNVDEVDIGKVGVGQRAKIVADAFPDDSFYGEVIRIAPLGKTQQNVTTFNVVILVKNIGGKLKAGMSASVDIEIFRRQNVVLVPNEALKDPRSEQGRALLASMKTEGTQKDQGEQGKSIAQQEVQQESKEAKPEKELSMEELRQKMQTASPEERQKLRAQMRERFEKMSPEERQRMFAQFQQRMGGSQGGQPGGSGGMMIFRGGTGGAEGAGGEGGSRTRRQSQVSNTGEVKERIVMVKQGEEFVPKLVKIGPSNFDYSEVLDGLNDGDEIQITTISRAKLAAEQMTERMRSMGGLGGMTGGRTPVPTGGRH
jgi:HlyD family secretion protein